MASVASQPPVRTPSGGTTDQIFQPLADCGNGNPAFYHQFFDDLDQQTSFGGSGTYGTYTITLGTTGGAWTQIAGIGGQGTLSSGTAVDQTTQIQLPVGSFTQNIAPKKLFFETSFTATTNITHGEILAGLVASGVSITAGTGAVASTNGIYFFYVGSTNVLTLTQVTGGTASSVTIPTAAYTISGGAGFALAFYQNRLGDILAYVDTQLVGFIPQSNVGTTGNPQNAGAVSRILGTSYTASTSNLCPTVAVWGSQSTATTATLDFLTAEQER
jgi:hypothetical protein